MSETLLYAWQRRAVLEGSKMPEEARLLEGAQYARENCPKCGARFPEFLRGLVQRSKRWFGIGPKRDYCAIICHECKVIIGWESPPKPRL